MFCCAVSRSTLQGHPDRRLRFGVVQDGGGKGPCALLQPERSQSTPWGAGQADGEQERGRTRNVRLQDAPSAPCSCLRPA